MFRRGVVIRPQPGSKFLYNMPLSTEAKISPSNNHELINLICVVAHFNLQLTGIHVNRVRLPVVFRYLVVDHSDDVGADRRLVNRWKGARAATRLLHSIVLIHRYHGARRRQRLQRVKSLSLTIMTYLTTHCAVC